jgi:hypothetical protein
MIAQRFPEALPHYATLFEVLTGEAVILYGCVFLGAIGYTLTLVVLGWCVAFGKRIPFRIMHKASMIVGIAFAALIQLYRIPFILYRPSDLAAILGISLAFLALVFGIGTAVRIVRRNAHSLNAH